MQEEIIKLELLKKISIINKTTPGVWLVVSNIIQNRKFTLILNKTLIISVYELTEKKLIMLYKILKELMKTKAITKVINKKEFLIVKLSNNLIIECLTNSSLWRLIDIKEIIDYNFPNTCSKLENNKITVTIDETKYEFSVDNKYINLLDLNNSKKIMFEYSYEYKVLEMTILDNFRKIKSN